MSEATASDLAADVRVIAETLECPNADAPFHTSAGCTWCAGTLPALDAIRRVVAQVDTLTRERDEALEHDWRNELAERLERVEARAEAAEAEVARLRDGLRRVVTLVRIGFLVTVNGERATPDTLAPQARDLLLGILQATDADAAYEKVSRALLAEDGAS